MIELLATTNNNNNTQFLVLLVVIAVCVTITVCVTWCIEPQWRKYLKPHKQWLADWWQVRIWKMRSRFPEAFTGPSPYKEQHLNIEKDLGDVRTLVGQQDVSESLLNELKTRRVGHP